MQKIVVADKNRLLREMLTKAISANDQLKIVSIVDSFQRLFDIVETKHADWVILSLPHGQEDLPLEVKEILVNFPEVGILVVSPDGRHMRVKWLEVHEQVLDGINLNGLIKLLSAESVSKTNYEIAA